MIRTIPQGDLDINDGIAGENTYIITPYSVDIMGDLIDELENNGLYL